MSNLPKKSDANVDALLQTQQGLIEAHLALIKMQQQMLGSAQLPMIKEAPLLKSVDSLTEIPAKLMGPSHASPPVGDEGGMIAEGSTGMGGAEGGSQPLSADAGPFLEVVRRNAFFIGTLAVFSVVMLFLAIRAHPPSEDSVKLRAELEKTKMRLQKEIEVQAAALKNNELALISTQKSLQVTQTKLATTEQALREAQQALGNASRTTGVVVRPLGPAPVEAKPVSNEQRLAQAQQDLRNAWVALAANQRELIKNLREYRVTARTLAMNRQAIFQTELEIRRAKGELSDGELTKQMKPWEEFLPPNARPLLNDPRLDAEETSVASATAPQTKDSLDPKDGVPATMPEVQALLSKTGAELTVVMKQLTDTQTDIIRTQADVTVALGELERKSQELLTLQNTPAGSALGTPQAVSQPRKTTTKNTPDASAPSKQQPDGKKQGGGGRDRS